MIKTIIKWLSPERAALSGSFEEIPFDQVCQLIATTEKTGVLQVEGARIFFENGSVVQGQEAFNSIIQRGNGEFSFFTDVEIPPHDTEYAVTHLLLEASRVYDEARGVA